MAITATDVDQLHQYAEGVMKRAGHHAGRVQGAALAVLGGIVWRADAGSIRIREYAGHMANMLWVTIGGRDYAFKYEHTTQKIEILDRSLNNKVLHSLDDTIAVADIQVIFKSL